MASMLSSCSTWVPHRPNLHVTDPTGADDLNAYDVAGQEVPVTNNVFKATNRQAYFTVERVKRGYISDYTTVWQNGVTPMVAIDAGMLLTGAVMTAAGGENELGDPSTTAILGPYLMIYGGLGVLLGKKKSFKKAVDLQPMTPIPVHQPGQMHLYVDNVAVKLSSGEVETRNFKSIKNYQSNLTEAGAMTEKKKVVSRFEVKDMGSIDASLELNELLKQVDFIDTTNTMFKMSQKANMVHVEVTDWDYNYIYGGAYSFQLTSKWTLKDNISKSTIIERSFTTASDIIVNDEDNDLYRKGFINALAKAMVQFMGSSEFADAMVDKRQKFQTTVDGWAPITLYAGKYATQKVGESSKSVVTVKTKEGHGSGVFVSTEGYLVTNLHVTGSQTEDLEIVLGDGTKFKGRVERSNPVYDLALVKVEGFKGKPLAISTSRDIELGESVFAVGTPTDVALGQTVTRGIISSKRNFGELDYIQTDVSINSGNSGGALLDDAGRLIGIVNAKIVGTGVEGVGFAIPSYYLSEALKVEIK
jgi:S1-C subfamily serine protease